MKEEPWVYAVLGLIAVVAVLFMVPSRDRGPDYQPECQGYRGCP